MLYRKCSNNASIKGDYGIIVWWFDFSKLFSVWHKNNTAEKEFFGVIGVQCNI